MNYQLSPFNTLNQMNRELSRIFDDNPASAAALELSHWSPRIDIAEKEDAFTVLADLPGVNPEDIEISLHEGVLTIRGERQTESEEHHGRIARRERTRGTFSRQFHLPELADEETVTAKCTNGVLQITIPKAKKARPISIQVEAE